MAVKEASIEEELAREPASPYVHLNKFFLYVPFLAPFLFLVLLYFFLPVVLTTGLAFTSMDSKMQWDFNGLANFKRLFSDPLMSRIALNTVIYVVCTCLFNVGFGLILALLTTYYLDRENVGLFFRSIWLLPRMTPSVIYILLWQYFLAPTDGGPVNQFLGLLGLPMQRMLARQPLALVILVNGVIGASFGMIIFAAAIKSIPVDLIRAARVDGASDMAIVRNIILPLLKWPLMFLTVWQTLSLLASYEYILLLTDGGPFYKSEVWSLNAYHRAFSSLQFGYGAAISLILVVVAILMTFLMLKLFGFRRLMEPSKIGT
jgi:inositol-phosphate transport system permease protein